MRVVILTETFAKNMGYAEKLLSKYLARLGVEVHVVTMDLPPYYQLKTFKETYMGFTNFSDLIPGTVEELDGFKLHVVGHRSSLDICGLRGSLTNSNHFGRTLCRRLPLFPAFRSMLLWQSFS